MENFRLVTNAYKEIIITEQIGNALFPEIIKNVTEDFLRCVVWKCSEQIEFEVDGSNSI